MSTIYTDMLVVTFARASVTTWGNIPMATSTLIVGHVRSGGSLFIMQSMCMVWIFTLSINSEADQSIRLYESVLFGYAFVSSEKSRNKENK